MARSVLPNRKENTARRSVLHLSLGLALLALPMLAEEDNPATPAPAAPDTVLLDTVFLDTVTVAATRSERALSETPGNVDVVAADEITELGHTGIADLVRYMPGVYVENDATRLGTSGFNIRGIGGNRILTQVDGVPTAEQFDFGPLSISQFQLDIDTLERVEVVRSAGSALYGSDALGGLVSLVTRSPQSYLGDSNQHLGLRVGWDGRADELSESLVYARGSETLQGSLVYTHRDSSEVDNQGEINSHDASRTAPNPFDRTEDNFLLKLSHQSSERSNLLVALEGFKARNSIGVFSSQSPVVTDFDAVDRRERQRLSVENTLTLDSVLANSLIWKAYWQQADTEQRTDEIREGSLGTSQRLGVFDFDQQTIGIDVEAHKPFGNQNLLTYGLLARRDLFDVLRDREETVLGNGMPVPTGLIFPTKYFPETEVSELGLFVQGEIVLAKNRLRLVPGIRFDRFELNPEANDQVFLSGNPGQAEPASATDEAFSPKLGLVASLNDKVSLFAQYARGFRAPPMSSVNNGFTNQAGGYRTLPNPGLQPETSDNFELGFRGRFARGSGSVTYFENRYEDFIETVFLGFNPMNFLVEFQPQNLEEVEISGFEIAGDVFLGNGWQLRGAWSHTEGDDVTSNEPLETIAPPRLVAGLRYVRPDGKWGLEISATLVDAKDESDLPAATSQFQQFPAPSYEVLDLAFWYHLNDRLMLQVSGWNLADETYWTWTNARGQDASSTTLDRYTSAGRQFGLQLRTQF